MRSLKFNFINLIIANILEKEELRKYIQDYIYIFLRIRFNDI